MVGTCSVCGTVSDVIVIAAANGEDSLICEGQCKFVPPIATQCECGNFETCEVCKEAILKAVDKLELSRDYTPPTLEEKARYRRWLNDPDPVINLEWYEAGGDQMETFKSS